jgi:hypothetical protein
MTDQSTVEWRGWTTFWLSTGRLRNSSGTTQQSTYRGASRGRAHLGRRELRIGLRAIHQRMPEYHITLGKSARLYTDGLRGLHSLPLRIGPRPV